MKLWEIEQGEQIRVVASTEKSKFEQTAFIEFSKDGVIFVKPMYYEGQLLNFDGEHLKISVVYIVNNEKPMVWEGCTIRYVQTKTQKFHAIFCKRDGIHLNRRQAFRQYLGIPGKLMVESTRERKEVIVKNISTTGVSFVMESMDDITMDDIRKFQLEFKDTQERLNIMLQGEVIREEDVENKKVFGALIKKTNVELSAYIAHKQKQDMARKRGK